MSYISNGSGAAGTGTVTNTGGALTANSIVLGAGGNDTKVSTAFTTNGTNQATIGVAGGGNGALALAGTTSGTATLTAPSVAGTTTNAVVSSNNITAPNLVAGTAADTVAGHMTAASGTNAGQIFIGSDAGVNLQRNSNNNLVLNVTANTNTVSTNGNISAAGTSGITASAAGITGLSLVASSATIGFSGGKGQHFVTQAANNDHCGTFTVSASTTGSVVFTTNYTSTPVVVLTPQTTGLTSWFLSAVSNSGFTVTVAPSGTYTFGYIVVGNPN